jgi:hypothetical protein
MSKSVGWLDVMKRMVDTNDAKIELSPLDNVTHLKKVKAGTQVTIGVSGDRVGSIYSGQYVGGLILVDRQRFNEVKAEMEKE